MMKHQMAALVIAGAFAVGATPVLADHHGDMAKGKMKPESRDMEKVMEHRREHMDDMDDMDDMGEMKGKDDGMHGPKMKDKGMSQSEGMMDAGDEAAGLEKQREMKMDQERKELGKGSEKGQEMREEKSKKWWKFWE